MRPGPKCGNTKQSPLKMWVLVIRNQEGTVTPLQLPNQSGAKNREEEDEARTSRVESSPPPSLSPHSSLSPPKTTNSGLRSRRVLRQRAVPFNSQREKAAEEREEGEQARHQLERRGGEHACREAQGKESSVEGEAQSGQARSAGPPVVDR